MAHERKGAAPKGITGIAEGELWSAGRPAARQAEQFLLCGVGKPEW
jgi:hypothetical protein